jgi:hypothetical protein
VGEAFREVLERSRDLLFGLGRLEIFAGGAVALPYPFYPETQRGSGRDRLPPDHVPRLGHSLHPVLLLGGGIRVDLAHLVVHVLPQLGLLFSLGQLFLEIRPHADLAVHHARRDKVAQEILQLDVRTLPVVAGHQTFVLRKRTVSTRPSSTPAIHTVQRRQTKNTSNYFETFLFLDAQLLQDRPLVGSRLEVALVAGKLHPRVPLFFCTFGRRASIGRCCATSANRTAATDNKSDSFDFLLDRSTFLCLDDDIFAN